MVDYFPCATVFYMYAQLEFNIFHLFDCILCHTQERFAYLTAATIMRRGNQEEPTETPLTHLPQTAV